VLKFIQKKLKKKNCKNYKKSNNNNNEKKIEKLKNRYLKNIQDRWTVAEGYWKKTEKFKNFDFEAWARIKIKEGARQIEVGKCQCETCVKTRGY